MYTAPDTPVARRELAYESLKTRLLRGGFAAGERLGEERLAAELGVSRTPVREALSRLQSDGFVLRSTDGYFPVVPDLHTVRELYDLRFGLERWAITAPLRGGSGHDVDEVAALRAEWLDLEADAAGDTAFVLLDEDFHVRLAASAGNGSLADHLQSVNERIRVVRTHDFVTAERISTTIEQHVAVLDAVIAGDLSMAEERLVVNFSESLAVVEERAAMAIARMVQGWGR